MCRPFDISFFVQSDVSVRPGRQIKLQFACLIFLHIIVGIYYSFGVYNQIVVSLRVELLLVVSDPPCVIYAIW